MIFRCKKQVYGNVELREHLKVGWGPAIFKDQELEVPENVISKAYLEGPDPFLVPVEPKLKKETKSKSKKKK